jgi:hypothetical protein
MNIGQTHLKAGFLKGLLTLFALAGLLALAPLPTQAANVGWAVSVGGGHGGGYGPYGPGYGGGYRGAYGGGWRPAAYGPAWGGGYGPGWRGAYYGPSYGYPYAATYYSPPVVTYVTPPQPMVLASQPQPAVWYYCEASEQYFPYVQSCPSGWQTQPATPPSSNLLRQRSAN